MFVLRNKQNDTFPHRIKIGSNGSGVGISRRKLRIDTG